MKCPFKDHFSSNIFSCFNSILVGCVEGPTKCFCTCSPGYATDFEWLKRSEAFQLTVEMCPAGLSRWKLLRSAMTSAWLCCPPALLHECSMWPSSGCKAPGWTFTHRHRQQPTKLRCVMWWHKHTYKILYEHIHWTLLGNLLLLL